VPVTRHRVVLVVTSAAAVTFAVLAAVVAVRGGAPFPVDSDLHRWAIAHRKPGLTTAARVVTATGAGPIAYLLAAAAGALAGGRVVGGRGLGGLVDRPEATVPGSPGTTADRRRWGDHAPARADGALVTVSLPGSPDVAPPEGTAPP
jgi:hypothetical protein